MALIFRKTAKGVAEIETRAHRLPPRLRSALIVVDGRRSDGDLHALVLVQPVETFAALAQQGFIERIESAPTAPAAAGFSGPGGTQAPAPRPAPPGATGAVGVPAAGADFPGTRRDAVRRLSDLIGPASENLAMRMEKARNADELRPLLALAAQSVANMRGKQAAADYALRYEDL